MFARLDNLSLPPAFYRDTDEEKLIMKSISRVSLWVVFAALLAFAPFAVGENTLHGNIPVASNSLLNHAPSAFLTVTFGPIGLLGDNGKKGCGQDWGFGFGKDSKDCGKSTAVPEGGTSLMYLALAGLCCFGAVGYRMHRHASVTRTN